MNSTDKSPIELQVGVKALLKREDGKYLLLRRNPERYPEVGAQWDIVGGRINPGKSLLENLKREIMEETKLSLVKKPTLKSAQDILIVPGLHVVRLTFVGEISGEPVLDGEHRAYVWLTLSEIKRLPSDEINPYFKELLDNGIFE